MTLENHERNSVEKWASGPASTGCDACELIVGTQLQSQLALQGFGLGVSTKILKQHQCRPLSKGRTMRRFIVNR